MDNTWKNYSYQISCKDEKLSCISLFESLGFALDNELNNMLHHNAPTYPRDRPYIYLGSDGFVHDSYSPAGKWVRRSLYPLHEALRILEQSPSPVKIVNIDGLF